MDKKQQIEEFEKTVDCEIGVFCRYWEEGNDLDIQDKQTYSSLRRDLAAASNLIVWLYERSRILDRAIEAFEPVAHWFIAEDDEGDTSVFPEAVAECVTALQDDRNTVLDVMSAKVCHIANARKDFLTWMKDRYGVDLSREHEVLNHLFALEVWISAATKYDPPGLLDFLSPGEDVFTRFDQIVGLPVDQFCDY